MTDEQLIQEARELPCTQWQDIDELIQQARSEETRKELDSIRKSKYHQEEASVYNI